MKVTQINEIGLIRLVLEAYHEEWLNYGVEGPHDEESYLDDLVSFSDEPLPYFENDDFLPADHEDELLAKNRQQKVYQRFQIETAFANVRSQGKRFNSNREGAWYCSFDGETSVHEVGYHGTEFLKNSGVYETIRCYVEVCADIEGKFIDIRDEPDHLSLSPNSEIGYPAGQKLARSLRVEGHKGIIYPSVRNPGGECLVIFDKEVIQNVHQGDTWQIKWEGSPEYTFEKIIR